MRRLYQFMTAASVAQVTTLSCRAVTISPQKSAQSPESDMASSYQSSTTNKPVFEPFPLIDDLSIRRPLAIARAITLVESSNPVHAQKISLLLRELRRRNSERESLRRAASKARVLVPIPPRPTFEDDADEESYYNSSSHSSTTEIIGSSKTSHPKSLFALNLEANRAHAVGSMRIAISGSPGAGKSTFIESLGMLLTETYGLRVGVIAVDPSSVISGGSLLGDKTRMEKLSCSPNAFVRPSPSRGHLGGVTARCWETMEIFEAADFDVILVETVGVGQSEIAARNMTDLFLLLVPPASGDELQGIKKGIVEVADIIVVTKNDGERKQLAKQTQMAYSRAVMFQRNSHNVGGGEEIVPAHRGGAVDADAMSDTLKPVMAISAEEVNNNSTIVRLWDTVERIWLRRRDQGRLSALRKKQCMDHFNEYFNQELIARARSLLGKEYLTRLEDEVVGKGISPRQGGDMALKEVLREQTVHDLPIIEK